MFRSIDQRLHAIAFTEPGKKRHVVQAYVAISCAPFFCIPRFRKAGRRVVRQCLKHSLEAAPNDNKKLGRLGSLELMDGDLESAVEHLRLAAKLCAHQHMAGLNSGGSIVDIVRTKGSTVNSQE